MRISDWSSDVCASDLRSRGRGFKASSEDGAGRPPRPWRSEGGAALHPAAAPLFRGKPRQEAGGTGYRPTLYLCLNAPDAEGPHLCADGEEPLHPRGKGAAAAGLSGAVIGRAHVCTPVPNALLVCRLMLDKPNHISNPLHSLPTLATQSYH